MVVGRHRGIFRPAEAVALLPQDLGRAHEDEIPGTRLSRQPRDIQRSINIRSLIGILHAAVVHYVGTRSKMDDRCYTVAGYTKPLIVLQRIDSD